MINEYTALPDISPSHNELHRKLFTLSFAILSEVATTPPTTDSLPPGYSQFYDDSVTGTRRLYMNLLGRLIYFEGKNV